MSYEIIPTGGVDVKKIKVKINNNIEDRYLMFIKMDSNNTFPRTFNWFLFNVSKTKEDMFGYVQGYFHDILSGSVQPTYTKNLSDLEAYKVFANRNYKLIENAVYIKNVEDNNMLDDDLIIDETFYKNYKNYKKLDNIILHNVVRSRPTKTSNLNWYGQKHILPFYDVDKIKYDENISEKMKDDKIEVFLSQYFLTQIVSPKGDKYIKEMDLVIQKLIEDKTSRYTLKVIKAVENIDKYDKKNDFKREFFKMYFNEYYIKKTLTTDNKLLVDKEAIFLMFKLSVENYNDYYFGKEVKQFIEEGFPKQFCEILKNNKEEVINIIEEKNLEIIKKKNGISKEQLIEDEIIFNTEIINDKYIEKLESLVQEQQNSINENKNKKTLKVCEDIKNLINYVVNYRHNNVSNNKYITRLYESLENSLEDINIDILKNEFKDDIKNNIIKKDNYIYQNIIKNINNNYLPKVVDFSPVLDKYENTIINQEVISKISLDMEEFANKNNIELLISYKSFFQRKFPYISKYENINKLIINKIFKKLPINKEVMELMKNILYIEDIPKSIYKKEFKSQRLKEEYKEKIQEEILKEEYEQTKKQKIKEAKNKFTVNDSFGLI